MAVAKKPKIASKTTKKPVVAKPKSTPKTSKTVTVLWREEVGYRSYTRSKRISGTTLNEIRAKAMSLLTYDNDEIGLWLFSNGKFIGRISRHTIYDPKMNLIKIPKGYAVWGTPKGDGYLHYIKPDGSLATPISAKPLNKGYYEWMINHMFEEDE